MDSKELDKVKKENYIKFKKLAGTSMPMTLEERNALEKFKDLLEEEDDYDSDIHFDGMLIRFLRGRKLDLKETMKMFKDYLKFYDDNKIESLITV